MTSGKNIFPYLALVSGVLALSFSGLFTRWAAEAPGPVIGLYRLTVTTLVLAPVFFYRRRKLQLTGGLVPLLPGAVLIFPLLGGLSSALDLSLWASAIRHTVVANATLLNNIAPLWVALVAWLLFREKLTPLFWGGLALTLSGSLLVLGNDLLRHPALGWGDILAIISSVFYAGYYLMTQRGRQDLDALSYTWLAAVSSTLSLLVICLVMRYPLTGYSWQTYLALLAAALISQVFGYLSISYALGHLPASVVSPTMIAQPVATALLAIPLLGEPLQVAQWLGGLAVLAGIYLVHYSRQKHPAAQTKFSGQPVPQPVETKG